MTHVKTVKRIDFDKKLRCGKAFLRLFSCTNSRQLDHSVIPTLVDGKHDVVLLHVCTNNILSDASDIELAINITIIALNGFLFINNDMITTVHPYRDGIYLPDIGTNMLSRNFYQVLNNFLFDDYS